MSKGARLVRHTGILMGMELGVTVLDTVVSVVLARYLAPQGFGLLSFALSFALLFSMVAGFGMGFLITREVAKDPQQISRYFANSLVVRVGLALLTLTAMWVAAQVMGLSAAKRFIVILAGLLIILDGNVRFTLSFFQGRQQMGTVALVYLAVRGTWLIVSLLIVWLRGGLIELLSARVLITMVGLVASIVLVDRRLQRIRWTIEPAVVWQLVKASVPFAVFRVYRTIYQEIDTVMLSMMVPGDLMTGWYTAGDKIRKAFGFIPSGFFEATLPALSRYSRDSRTDLVDTLTQSCKYLVVIALPIAAGIYVFAERFIALLYGPAYEAAVPALRLLMLAMPVMFVNSALSSAGLAVNLERQVSTYRGVGALFNILTNLWAIPRFGAAGAAVATLATEGLVLLLQLNRLRQLLPDLSLFRQLVKPCGAALAMLLFTWSNREAGLVYAIVGSALVYLTALIATRTVGKDEWAIVKRLVRIAPLEEPV